MLAIGPRPHCCGLEGFGEICDFGQYHAASQKGCAALDSLPIAACMRCSQPVIVIDDVLWKIESIDDISKASSEEEAEARLFGDGLAQSFEILPAGLGPAIY